MADIFVIKGENLSPGLKQDCLFIVITLESLMWSFTEYLFMAWHVRYELMNMNDHYFTNGLAILGSARLNNNKVTPEEENPGFDPVFNGNFHHRGACKLQILNQWVSYKLLAGANN